MVDFFATRTRTFSGDEVGVFFLTLLSTEAVVVLLASLPLSEDLEFDLFISLSDDVAFGLMFFLSTDVDVDFVTLSVDAFDDFLDLIVLRFFDIFSGESLVFANSFLRSASSVQQSPPWIHLRAQPCASSLPPCQM